MNPISMSLLATFFTTTGAVVGVPSLAFLLFYAVYQATKLMAGASAATDFGRHPDAVLLILKGMTAAIGAIGGLVNAAAELLVHVLAVASLAALALAALCWFTGHGLRADAGWARVGASLVLVPLLLVSLVLALSVGNPGRVSMLAIAACCLLALHAAWTGSVVSAG